MKEEVYLLAKAVNSAVFTSLMNAWTHRESEWDSNRHFKQADKLESKFITTHGMHPLKYIEIYEGRL